MTTNPHQRSIRRRAIGLSAALGLAACQADRQVQSLWPPPDFRVEVQAFELHADGSEHRQRFEVDATGLAIYRESHGDLPGAPLRIPVFGTVAVYELDPRSVRSLARLLQLGGLFEADGERSSNASDRGRQVTVIWRAHGAEGRLSTLSLEVGPLERVIRVLEAFMPRDRRVQWPGELTHPPLERRIEEAPRPLDSLPGSVQVHEEIARRNPEEEWALLHLFAIAVEAASFQSAEDALRTLASLPRTWGEDSANPEDYRLKVIEPLTALLEARRGAALAGRRSPLHGDPGGR